MARADWIPTNQPLPTLTTGPTPHCFLALFSSPSTGGMGSDQVRRRTMTCSTRRIHPEPSIYMLPSTLGRDERVGVAARPRMQPECTAALFGWRGQTVLHCETFTPYNLCLSRWPEVRQQGNTSQCMVEETRKSYMYTAYGAFRL